MSEKELNSYRFASGNEPSDDMLRCIMKEVTDDAMARRRKAEQRVNETVDHERTALREEWNKRLSAIL